MCCDKDNGANLMENVISTANKFRYTSLNYVDSEDIANAKIVINTKDNMFLYKKTDMKKSLYWNSKSNNNIQLYWASITKEKFFQGLNETLNFIKKTEIKAEKVYLEFIPEDFMENMSKMGFTVVSEWVDFWCNCLSLQNTELKSSLNIRTLKNDEVKKAGEVTRSCFGYSRGFTGEPDEVIKEWSDTENSCVFVAESDNEIVGTCLASLYGFNSEKGTVLWIRELAVNPNYQSKGIGHQMLIYAIRWGTQNGAKRSFLACDSENLNAIKLYESFNYKRKNERGQINMEIDLKNLK